ncbi:hypothetical protein LP420_02765 [Massilia sp. B-10]|nr:hypothetical protein LP420_02765 [Massilia sp. B-10]
MRQLGERGTRAAIILTAGLNSARRPGPHPETSHAGRGAPLHAAPARPQLRGHAGAGNRPQCQLRPHQCLARQDRLRVAVGALVTGVLDWANSRGIGFSKFISLGDSADIDFGDLLDYLASDPATSAILLYVEDVRHARKFMSAARCGRAQQADHGAQGRAGGRRGRAAASHTGALAKLGRRVRRGHPAQPACCACSPPKTCSRRSKRWPARGPCSASGWRS